MVGKQLYDASLPSIGADESGRCKRRWVGEEATDPLKLLVAVEVADLSCIPLLIEVLDAVIAIVDHVFGDLALKAPAGVLADVFFPAAVAFLSLAPAVDAEYLADNALHDAEGVASIISSGAVPDRPPAGGRLV